MVTVVYPWTRAQLLTQLRPIEDKDKTYLYAHCGGEPSLASIPGFDLNINKMVVYKQLCGACQSEWEELHTI